MKFIRLLLLGMDMTLVESGAARTEHGRRDNHVGVDKKSH